jgi:CheY-specific phosphatase CheX
MLAMTPSPTLIAEEFCVAAGHISGSVSLSGAWKGRIEVRMASELAYEATAAMMMHPAHIVGESDALDAAKEIANMIAGTIKSSLPRPCSTAVPESVVECDGFCGQPQTEDSLVVAFRHAAGDLMVRVREQECG